MSQAMSRRARFQLPEPARAPLRMSAYVSDRRELGAAGPQLMLNKPVPVPAPAPSTALDIQQRTALSSGRVLQCTPRRAHSRQLAPLRADQRAGVSAVLDAVRALQAAGIDIAPAVERDGAAVRVTLTLC